MISNFRKGDKVLIYNCLEYVGGGAGIIIDKDVSEPDKPAYLIIDVFDSEKEMTRWVKPENMKKLNFEKPKTLWEKFIGIFR